VLEGLCGSDHSVLTRLRAALLNKGGDPRTKGLMRKSQPKSPALYELQQRWQPLLAEWNYDEAGPDGFDLARQMVLLFRAARRHFSDICREQNRYVFSDLARRLVDLLSDADAVHRLVGNFRYILVDEFQDTNELHWQIIARLAGGDPRAPVRSDGLMI